jgi:hypothetical protein
VTALVHHGIQFVQVDKINCELRIVGSDDAGIFLWASSPVDDVALGEASRLRGAVFPEDPEPRHLINLLKG